MELIKSNQVNEIKSVKSCAHKKIFKYYVFLFCGIYIEGTKTNFFFFYFKHLSVVYTKK